MRALLSRGRDLVLTTMRTVPLRRGSELSWRSVHTVYQCLTPPICLKSSRLPVNDCVQTQGSMPWSSRTTAGRSESVSGAVGWLADGAAAEPPQAEMLAVAVLAASSSQIVSAAVRPRLPRVMTPLLCA